MTLGQRIRDRRKHMGFTLRKVAEISGFTVAYLSDIERDQTSPSIKSLKQMANALDIAISSLLGEGVVETDAPEWRVTDRVREIIETTVQRAELGEWVTIDPIFLQWLWADFLKMERLMVTGDGDPTMAPTR